VLRLFDGQPLAMTDLTITSIKPKPDNAALLVVRAGRTVLAVISRADAQRLDLAEGQAGIAAGEQLIARLAEADEYIRARTAMAAWIDKAPLSRAVVEKKAAAKGFSHDLIQRLLAEFAGLGLINDAELAVAATEHELHRKPAGTGLLRDKLVRRGIEEDLAESVASRATAGRDLLADAVALCRSRMALGSMKADPVAARRKLFGLLGRRGFEEEVAVAAIERVLGPESEPI
jgi:regulatory protein